MLLKTQATFVDAFGKTPAFREWNAPSPGLGQFLVTTDAFRAVHWVSDPCRNHAVGYRCLPSSLPSSGQRPDDEVMAEIANLLSRVGQ